MFPSAHTFRHPKEPLLVLPVLAPSLSFAVSRLRVASPFHRAERVQDIRQLSHERQRESILLRPGYILEAKQIGEAPSGELTVKIVHGPSMTEVPGVPVVAAVTAVFGFWFSVIRGSFCGLEGG